MTMRSWSGAMLSLLVLGGSASAQQPTEAKRAPAAPTLAEATARAQGILARMSLEEKIDYIGGTEGFYIRAMPALGLPAIKMSDGPIGVRNYGATTAFTAGIALAASWDTALAWRVGTELGRDGRARGVHILLGPGINIHRAPMNGRNFEYLGEDPFLAGRIAAANIRGIQSQGVIATAKHYLANNQEFNRHGVSSDMDERTMREIYLPAFEAAVKDGGVGAIMDSYNLINGVHATQNAFVNTQVLRKDWGFTGIVMSDWVATYDGVAAANGGLDLEMPSAQFMNKQVLLPAVQQGKVSQATIDEKVMRILTTAIRFGFLDRPQLDPSIPLHNQQARQLALEEALHGMVLLKNEGVLPLDRSAIHTIAVIGPDANPAVVGGGGSSRTTPYAAVSFLQGISNAVGPDVVVSYAYGVERPAPTGRDDRNMNAISAADALAQAVDVARRADAVLLCVGFDARNEREGADRTFALPPGQDDLIKAVVAANKRVVVVLTAGGNVDMQGWIDATPALLHAWYPGQEGGIALAKIVFGDVSPSGKLPVSFERRWEDNATFHSYYDESGGKSGAEARPSDPAPHGHVAFSEGVFLGYRHFDRSDVKPLFPFGFGLSYTTFAYANLKLTPPAGDATAPFTVSFDVTNTGARAGAEVAQVYVGEPKPRVPRPVKELKGFARVELQPGETRTVTVALDRRAFSYWDLKKGRWTADPGTFDVLVGGSSVNLPLRGTVRLTR